MSGTGRRRAAALLAAATVCAGAEALAAADRPDLWFPVGEETHYRIYWGVVPVGRSYTTTQWIEEDGRTLLSIRFRTRTTDILSKLYPVDDFLEAVIEPRTFLPVRFTKRLSEGRYRCDEITTFDHGARTAHWESRTSVSRKDVEIDADTRDIITFMYYMRSRPLEPGLVQHFRVMADEKVYDLTVRAREAETFRVMDYGPVSSVRIEPEAAFQGLFVRKGRLWLWVSADERRLLTKMVARVPVASIALWLTEVRGPGNDRWVATGPRAGEQAESKAGKSHEHQH